MASHIVSPWKLRIPCISPCGALFLLQIMMFALEDIKRGEETRLGHSSNVDAVQSPPGEKRMLMQEKSLSTIDVENRAAHKGDSSDGAVDWTVRNVFAFIFLCMLYTGTRTSRNPW